jgi:methyl-accepting chemotaxis protein
MGLLFYKEAAMDWLEKLKKLEPLKLYTVLSAILSLLAAGPGSYLLLRLWAKLDPQSALQMALFMGAMGLGMTSVNYLLVRLVIRTRIQSYSAFVDQVAKGNLGLRLEESKNDLFGQFAANLNAMAMGMQVIVREVVGIAHKVSASAESLSASAEQMNASAEEITSTVQQIAKGVETQAEKTVETSQVMSNMSGMVQQVAGKSEAASRVSNQAWETAVRGNEAVQEALERMNQIFDTATQSASAVRGLGEQSKQIGQVVGLITGIADQTNLLALNAAIEAARAGEAGRGFAVVADEVRKLAEGSAKAAAEIGKLIKQIQAETTRAVVSMEHGAQELARGREVASRAGVSLEEILQVVRQVDEMAKEIYALTRQQAAGTDQVVKAVEEIAAVAEETAAGTQEASASTQEQTASMQEMAAAAQELADLAETMKSLVSRFKL